MVNKKTSPQKPILAAPKDKIKRIKKDTSSSVAGSAEFLGAKNQKVIKRWENPTGTNGPIRWWTQRNLYQSVDATVDRIEQAQTRRRMTNIKYARMYGNYDSLGLSSINYMRESNTGAAVSFNAVQSVIDACAAKIAKDQPKVSFVTTGAEDYFLRLRATKLTKYISGLFKQSKVYENSENVFRDACVFGTGYLKIYQEDNRIKTQWIPADMIRVDELDGLEQKPKSIHQVSLIPRDELLIRHPEYRDKIVATMSALYGKVSLNSTVDLIRVIESWHLPTIAKSDSEAGSGDGVHCLTLENCTLFEEVYDKDCFPIIAFRWYNKPLGWFGRGITEEIQSLQIRINSLLRTVQQSQDLVAIPLVFVPMEAEIPQDVIGSNEIARIVKYQGPTPPSFFTPEAQNPEIYNHINQLIQWCFQLVGLSQTSASGMKPAGVDSAVAIREVSDIETGRFAQVAQRWEQFFVDIARVQVDLSRELFLTKPELSATVMEKKILREIRWKDVADMMEHPFEIQVFPTSQLPDTPAGRIQTITEYIQNQWISKERGMELLNLDPDLENEVNMQTSSLRLTEKWLSEMVEDGIYHKPNPYMNLALAQQIATGVLNQLECDGCPEDRLELVRQFIMDIVALQTPQPMLPPQPEATPLAPLGNAPAPLVQTIQ